MGVMNQANICRRINEILISFFNEKKNFFFRKNKLIKSFFFRTDKI